MRLILNHILMNRLFLLSLFDIAIISWISWYESGIEYEPLLDFEEGKTLITNYVSVVGLYLILCVVHLNICMFYLYVIKEKE